MAPRPGSGKLARRGMVAKMDRVRLDTFTQDIRRRTDERDLTPNEFR